MTKKTIAITCLCGLLMSGSGLCASPNDYRRVLPTTGREINFSEYGVVMNRLPVKVIDTGGTLIFSDSPEYVKEDGILYRDKVKGEARVLYYHLNDSTERKKIAVVLENLQNAPVTVKIKRSGDGRPEIDNYCRLGKETQAEYFQSQFTQTFTLAPGEKRLLSPKMGERVVKPQELVYGVYDFDTNGTVQVTVVSCPASVDPGAFTANAPVLPADELHLRGTFPAMNRLITLARPYDVDKNGAACIMLVDNEIDKYRQGIDATDGSVALNQGNYGITYWLDIPTVGEGKTRYLLAPLGGVYAGAMKVHEERKHPHMVLTPDNELLIGDGPWPTEEDYRLIQPLAAKNQTVLFHLMDRAPIGDFPKGKRILFEFSPPGASNLPVYFVMMPE